MSTTEETFEEMIANSDELFKTAEVTQTDLFEGKPGPGRPKGSKNKTTTMMKELLMEAVEQVGGVDELVRFYHQSNTNKKTFWNLAAKLLPKNMEVEGNDLHISVISYKERDAED